MTGTNRKEKKKIIKNITYTMLTIIVLFAIVEGSMLFIHHLKSEIISYEQDEDFTMSDQFITEDGYIWYDMSYEEAKDIVENPENYRGYYINIEINNLSGQKVYCVQANLSKQYKDIWMHGITLEEWDIATNPISKYSGSIHIMVKTSNKTEEEIDQLIRSIGITVSAENSNWIPFVTSETIYFEK